MAGHKIVTANRIKQTAKLATKDFWNRLFLAVGIEGMSLAEFCKDETVTYQTVSWRLQNDVDLHQRYSEARKERAQQNLDRISYLSEQVLLDPGNSNAYKISYEMKKWQAQVLDRAVFGEKVEQTVNVNIDLNTAYLDQLKTLMSDKPKIIEQPKLIDIVED